MKHILSLTLTLTLLSLPAQADFFGGDDAILSQILQNAVQQLIQMQGILGTDAGTLALLSQVNAGIEASLNFLHTVAPDIDPGIYKGLGKVQDALGKVTTIYGTAVPSSEFPVQQDTDTEVAEAIALHNSMFTYSHDLDSLADQINQNTQAASPGRAQQLTAHTLGIILHAVSASNKIQSASLKLQAQALEVQNHKDKESSRLTMKMSDQLEKEMREAKVDFGLPRF